MVAADWRNQPLAGVLGWLVLTLGLVILLGWVADIPLLRSLVPHQVEAKANTAFAFVLLGAALGLKAGGRSLPGGVLAAAGGLLGLVTLLQYPAGRNWGIDELVFRDVLNPVNTVHPGRMAPPTALNFVLMSLALLLCDTRERRLAGWLAFAGSLIAVFGFMGNLYGVPGLTSFGPYTAMAAPTGATFLLLGIGVLMARDLELPARLRQSVQTAGLVGVLLLLLLLAGAVVRNTQQLIARSQSVVHTHEVIGRLLALLSAMQEVETSGRGFLLGGDPRFLERYEPSVAAAGRLQQELRVLTADNSRQQERLAMLAGRVTEKLAVARLQVTLRQQGGVGAARMNEINAEGKRRMDAVRRTLDELITEEETLLQARQHSTEAGTINTLFTLGLGLAVTGAGLITIFGLLRREIAARTHLAAELRHSEESLAVTLHSIGDAVMATDTAGRITLLNPVAEQLTGWPLAEARGRPVAEIFRIINEQTRAPAPLPVDAVLATGEIKGLANHTALIARDGTERAIADSAAPIRDAAGRVLGVVLVFRDVTESRRAQAQLDRFFELSIDFLCIASQDGYFKRASPAVTEILGWSVEEFLARPYMEQIHPDDQDSARHQVEVQAAGEKVLYYECRFRHKDGSWRLLAWRSMPHEGFMYASARDITEARAAEEQIRALNGVLRQHAAQLEVANAELDQRRAELQSLFESLPGLYLVLTPDHRIVAVSDAYLEATMTRRESILGRGLFEVFPDNPGDPQADGVRNLRASLERVAASRVADTMAIQRYDVRRPDGVFEERYWSPINSPLLGTDRRLRYIIHRVEDVTAFVRQKVAHATETGDAALRARLEQVEAEVFRSSRQVQAANEQLHLANQELESFCYSVSHDLRAPLRHVQGYVEMLKRETQGGLPEKAQRYVNTIADAAREMGQLIDDLLAFSRMGRTEMTETEVDLAAVLAEVRRSLETDAAGREIRWTVAPLPRVRGDAAMLRQVLLNLLGNAVKYTRRRAVAEIAVGCAGEEAGRTVFCVRDNGAGFDMKYADKLFGVFQRLHRADEFEGTGIGLATVRRIIGRHGGRTWAEARVDAGATFYFTLQPAFAGNPARPAA